MKITIFVGQGATVVDATQNAHDAYHQWCEANPEATAVLVDTAMADTPEIVSFVMTVGWELA